MIFAAIIGWTSGVSAEDQKPTLEISGFFDVSAAPLTDRDNPFALGPFELDLESTLNDHISGSAAVVLDTGEAFIGPAFIDLHYFGEGQSSHSPRGRIFSDPGYHIQFGQFDVPFGLDYLFYATPDRPTITPPLSTDLMFEGGWTHPGIRIFKAHPIFNASAYMVNGFNPGYVAGGRLGIRPLENPFSSHRIRETPLLEIGVSGAIDLDQHSSSEGDMRGADLEMNIPGVRVLAEYILMKHKDTGLDQRSWYVLAVHPVEVIDSNIIARYEEYREDTGEGAGDTTTRLTVAVSKSIFHITRLKVEYHRFPRGASRMEEHRDGFAGQLAITF